ncbi:MAG: polyprenyl synthetase family protein [Chlamydiota bacterium]|nr:polyprenyl synthetase family protein [Chlamydiota bacterium]
MTTANSINQYASLFPPYLKKIETAIKKSIPNFGPETPIRKACEYALLNGGKRFRPVITLMVAEALNKNADVMQAALTVEYFHTASLVADDLPCMDDDDDRRNQPALHKAFGEGMALLVTYALIAEGYRCLYTNAASLANSSLPHANEHEKICLLALENATQNTGLCGATGGQFMDICPPDLSLETIKEIIHKKTTTLFEISFVLGWLYGGGDIKKIDILKRAAKHFGLAFQIADDIGDIDQDITNERSVNVATLFGLEEAKKMFHEETEGYLNALEELEIKSSNLQTLIKTLLPES